jgi:hypothetical protein
LNPVASYEFCDLLSILFTFTFILRPTAVVRARVAFRLQDGSAYPRLPAGLHFRAHLNSFHAPPCRRHFTIAIPLAMFGIGPMLPVISAAEKCDRSSKKVQKRKFKRGPSAASHELAIMRRPSTIKTESTLFEDNGEYAVQQPSPTPHHQRDLSLIVDFDLDHAAAQLNDGEISDLELALFAFWIKAKHDNYFMAKGLVRELALDQVSVSLPLVQLRLTYNDRAIMLTRSLIRVYANYSRKYMMFAPGSSPGKTPSQYPAGSGDPHRNRLENSTRAIQSDNARRRVWLESARVRRHGLTNSLQGSATCVDRRNPIPESDTQLRLKHEIKHSCCKLTSDRSHGYTSSFSSTKTRTCCARSC